jgi:hypothetical protein
MVERRLPVWDGCLFRVFELMDEPLIDQLRIQYDCAVRVLWREDIGVSPPSPNSKQ